MGLTAFGELVSWLSQQPKCIPPSFPPQLCYLPPPPPPMPLLSSVLEAAGWALDMLILVDDITLHCYETFSITALSNTGHYRAGPGLSHGGLSGIRPLYAALHQGNLHIGSVSSSAPWRHAVNSLHNFLGILCYPAVLGGRDGSQPSSSNGVVRPPAVRTDAHLTFRQLSCCRFPINVIALTGNWIYKSLVERRAGSVKLIL